MKVDEFLAQLNRKDYFRNNISKQFTEPAKEAEYAEIPSILDERLRAILQQTNINRLYRHQQQAVLKAAEGKNLVVSTGVASGKSLCYLLPMLNDHLKNAAACGLLLFPTKALTQDQMKSFSTFLNQLPGSRPDTLMAIYDGDTSQESRQQIRQQANFVLTNPDMLHLGILPHHTKWARFMGNLKYIIIDEVHVYRGIFGSHFCNVLRRLKRIISYYGAEPQFILTSATLYNVKEFITRLLEEDFELISENGAPSGEKHLILYNPPLLRCPAGFKEEFSAGKCSAG